MDGKAKLELAHLIRNAFVEHEKSFDPATKTYAIDLDKAVAKTCPDPDLTMVVRLCLAYSEGLQGANKTIDANAKTKKTGR